MKKTNRILVAVVFSFFAFNVISQTHVITLNVDTANLTQENTSSESISSFTAPTAQVDVASPPENFQITVENGATIIWKGASSSSNDTVDIFMIKWERGPRIFSNDEIPRNENGNVQARINGSTPDEAYKYKILFKVNGTGAMYQIDPKIKILPGN
jgi:hypothetical protein